MPQIYTELHVTYQVLVNLFIQVYEMFDLDPPSWAALVAQLVRASVRSVECRGFKSHLRQLIFHFPQVPVFLSFFIFISSHHVIVSGHQKAMKTNKHII